jgi:hypothetical protein
MLTSQVETAPPRDESLGSLPGRCGQRRQRAPSHPGSREAATMSCYPAKIILERLYSDQLLGAIADRGSECPGCLADPVCSQTPS